MYVTIHRNLSMLNKSFKSSLYFINLVCLFYQVIKEACLKYSSEMAIYFSLCSNPYLLYVCLCISTHVYIWWYIVRCVHIFFMIIVLWSLILLLECSLPFVPYKFSFAPICLFHLLILLYFHSLVSLVKSIFLNLVFLIYFKSLYILNYEFNPLISL